jgi:hypothetical protein
MDVSPYETRDRSGGFASGGPVRVIILLECELFLTGMLPDCDLQRMEHSFDPNTFLTGDSAGQVGLQTALQRLGPIGATRPF